MWKLSIANSFADSSFKSMCHSQKLQFNEVGIQTGASLPLQAFLYFNLWVFPAWFLIVGVNLDDKYYDLTNVYKVVTVTIFLVSSTSEVARLYMGYFGNLSGKIPELASFWLISTLIQFPLEILLLFDSGTLPRFSEKCITFIAISLLIGEIVMGTVAVRNLADRRAKAFYLMQLYDVGDMVI